MYYKRIPKRYQNLKEGTANCIGNYVYFVSYEKNFGKGDKVWRITDKEYVDLRFRALSWDLFRVDPTDANMQNQIWSYVINSYEPYIVDFDFLTF